MDIHAKTLATIKEKQMIDAFTNNQMDLMFFDDKEALNNYLKDVLVNQKSVALGGSMSLKETGVFDLIYQSDVKVIDRYEEGLSRKETMERFREGFSADLFFTSSNAITVDGCLYNVDGTGNRVAAMIFGPKEVYVIAGINKIFDNEAEAINHIKTVSAPANAIRLNRKTPCAKTGRCMECNSPDRICSSYVKLGYQSAAHRIKVLIIRESVGY